MERIDFDERRTAQRQLLLDVRDERPPDVQLEDVDAVQRVEIGERKLEERPLVAFEIDGKRERQRRERLDARGVQQLDPEVDVAVGLRPGAVAAVKGMARVGRGIERPELVASQVQRLAHGRRPLRAIEPVPAVQRQRDPLEPETDARGVRDRAVGGR